MCGEDRGGLILCVNMWKAGVACYCVYGEGGGGLILCVNMWKAGVACYCVLACGRRGWPVTVC